MSGVQDRAGKEYWDDLWTHAALPAAIDPSDAKVRNYVNRRFAAYLDGRLSALPAGAELLEIGCARSAWLPYFAREYGLRVTGLDYSQPGCDLSRAILRRDNATGEVVYANLFAPPERMLGRFDVVVSFGVVEHFTDTSVVIRAIGRLAKPGGQIITEIPNLAGMLGWIRKNVNAGSYRMHVPLTAGALAAAHRKAGLVVGESLYFLPASFGLWHLRGVPDSTVTRALDRLRQVMGLLTYPVWLLDDHRALPSTRLLSPYVVCAARKPR